MITKRIQAYRLFIILLLFNYSTTSTWAQVETNRIDELQRKLEAFANRGTGLNETVTISLNGSVQEMIALLAESTQICLLYTSPSPRDRQKSRMPSSA